jgi:hypothetical protein
MSRAHQRRRRSRPHGGERNDPDLLLGIRRALQEDHPLALLAAASQYLAATASTPSDRFLHREPVVERDLLLQSFREIDRFETTGLLSALSLLLRAGPAKAAIDAELGRRTHRLPDWVGELGQAGVTGVVEVTHILGDGDDVMVEVAWPDGNRMTTLVYIDHNVGTVVKDAFVVSEGLETIRRRFEEASEPGASFDDLDPAEARTRILTAIQDGERMLPPFESDTWPACRPLVEWVAGMLPEGGTGYVRPEWTVQQQIELAERFLDSPFAEGLADREHRDLVENLLWFGCDYGPGDPLRWSPVSVEILLIDWFPRKIDAPFRQLRLLPDVLRAFIRFAHHERGIPADLTRETVTAVNHWEREYLRAVRNPNRPMGALALAEAARLMMDFEERSTEEHLLDWLAGQVGGPDALDRLDASPLPDEPFDWGDIPEDTHPRVAEVLELTDRCCDELLDVEYRTSVRRLLARVASGDPEVFRRKGRADTAAAALVWSVGRANDLFRQILVKDLMAWFGLATGSVSQRANTLLRAAGVRSADDWYSLRPDLGDPALLHSAKRRQLIELRDRYRSRLDKS